MFGNIKPTASLSSGLLARRGQARPAMRPQGFHELAGGPGSGAVAASVDAATSLEDLGWNDMGDDAAPVVSIATAAAPLTPPIASVPPVLVERAALMDAVTPEVETPVVPEVSQPLSADAARRIVRGVAAQSAKAAFTLRLDPERHLRLRLASASRNRSAQAIVVQALDAFIASLPEVEGLAAQLSSEPSGSFS